MTYTTQTDSSTDYNRATTLCVGCGEECREALIVRFSRPLDGAQIARGSVCEDCAPRMLRRAQDGTEAVPAEVRWP
ncbi:hypothetical protein [Halocatena marina]|uniref:hypothetical protein n=1 Tax=Halocatena marina TaxID=2934937 RepID=UPI00200E392E|nr:hypothetical protein [Halocatena marina]